VALAVQPRRRIARRAALAVAACAVVAGCGGNEGWVARDVPGRYSSIQAAVDAAHPGDLVRIAPGVYDQSVVVAEEKQDVVIRGEDRNRTVLDGGGRRSVGILVRGQGTAIENLTVRRYKTAGVLMETPRGARRPLRGWRVSYVTAIGAGRVGVLARAAQGGTVDHVLARGFERAGVLFAECAPCDGVVIDGVADRSRAGFEARDASDNLIVARSRFSHNRLGVVLSATRTDEGVAPGGDVTIAGNTIADNDEWHSPGGGDRFGIGVLVSGGRGNAIARNLVTRHATAGILIEAGPAGPAAEISVQGNVLAGNGLDLALARSPRQPTSKGSCFAQNRFTSSLPHDIEKVLPCQADVPLPVEALALPPAAPAAPPRAVALPAPQAQLPEARTAAPKPARPPGRLDVARIGVPGSG